MSNDAAQPAAQPETAGPANTGSGHKDPTGIEGENPALDDTGKPKAAEVGEPAEQPEDPQSLDLTPEGLADSPAQQEDADIPAEPETAAPENS
jgi:hypothetical protein